MGVTLSRPVRLRADLDRPPWLPADVRLGWFGGPETAAWSAALADAGLFFLELGYPPRGAEAALADLVQGAVARGVEVTLIVAAGDLRAEAVPSGVARLLVDLTAAVYGPESFERDMAEIHRWGAELARPELRIGVALTPRAEGMEELAAFLRLSAAAGFEAVELHPPPLIYLAGAEATSWVPGAEDYRRLARLVDGMAAELSRLTDARVHDVVLWHILREAGLPGRDEGFAGCQAAGALAQVTPQGAILPCLALPVPLGTLDDLASGQVFRSAAARAVGTLLAAEKRGCAACHVEWICHGGCPAVRGALRGAAAAAPEEPFCVAFRRLFEARR